MALVDLPLHDFTRPADLAALCDLLARRKGKASTILLAGGTDWIVERHMAPAEADGAARPLVVDVSRLAELRGITVEDGRVTIGAATPYLEIRRHAFLESRAPLLSRMSRDVGAIQIQARGTLGGNLATASPAADGVAALAALDATLVLSSVRGERLVPLDRFYTGYKKTVREDDEAIKAVTFTLPKPGARTYWRKVGTRAAQAISKVALAGVAEVVDGRITRIGLGMASVAPTTAFLPTVRTLALDTPIVTLTADMLTKATDEDIAPIDDVRSTAAYRRHVARALVLEFFRSVGAPV